MNAKKLTGALMILFLVLVGSFLIAESLKRPRILVLHSYYTDYAWVKDIDVGIKRGLANRPYNVRYHYMDTKRHPFPEFMEKAGVTARRMINEWQPDIIIAIDDNAQKYVAKHYIDDPSKVILFSGLNAELQDYGYDKAKNVSGIIERIPYDAARDIYLQVLPADKRRIYHISDDSETSVAIHKELENFDWSPLKFVESRQISTIGEWKKAVKDAEDVSDCLMITHYHTLKDDNDPTKIVKPQEVVEWTEKNTNLPTLGFWGFFVEEGGMMAVAVSPYEQGEIPARMAVSIIEGAKGQPGRMPFNEVSKRLPWQKKSPLRHVHARQHLPRARQGPGDPPDPGSLRARDEPLLRLAEWPQETQVSLLSTVPRK
ncbi:MAG: hypothetical protein M5U26_20030 [Planctomycetota bacterium]|nr:hypothetical protein [Planctomycetota bacterium]